MVVVTNSSAPSQSIENQPSWANPGLCQQRNCSAHCLARCFCGSNPNTQSLDNVRHEKSVADCQDRRTVDHDAIEERGSLSDQTPKERTSENFSRVRRAPSARQDGKLTSRRRKNIPGDCNVLVDDLDFSGGNLARCRGYVGLTQQAINDSRLKVFIRIVFRARETKDLVHGWPAQIAVNKKHAITLLGQGKRIIGAGETFSLVRHCAGE